MKCEQIQELILTDYMDERMTPTAKEALEKHLMGCSDCLEFARVAKAASVEPFEGAMREKAPEHLWESIREDILVEQERGSESWLDKFSDVFRPAFTFSRPAAAFAGMAFMVMAVMLVHFSTSNKSSPQIASGPEEIEYMAALSVRSDVSSMGSSLGYGTNVEQYFL